MDFRATRALAHEARAVRPHATLNARASSPRDLAAVHLELDVLLLLRAGIHDARARRDHARTARRRRGIMAGGGTASTMT